jgi:hypothetical protein
LDSEQQNALRKAVEQARGLLEQEISDQLEGLYNILPDGTVMNDAPGDPVVRSRLCEAFYHHRARGVNASEAVAQLTRECAFTVLNRFAALKMAERRRLVRECVSQGVKSEGIQELRDLAPDLQFAFEDGGYRLLLETIMDELSLDLKQLFDRRSPASLIWPRAAVLEQLLEILNKEFLDPLWEQDETIGWIYQYFNSEGDRRKARYDHKNNPKPPQDKRELAVRNQFFTPHYVVSFLTDNTLGRTWYEMRKGETCIKEECEFLISHSNEVFLSKGETCPTNGNDNYEYIPHRSQKDPRDIKILDPACGSGHFLLYAFDLLIKIYQEAWEDPASPSSEVTGNALQEDYPVWDSFRSEIPNLILNYNLYGIDIDSRAVQIGAIALWMRAQREYNVISLKPNKRPAIQRINLVTAEPMPGEQELLDEFIQTIHPPLLGQLVKKVFEEMQLAGEAGSLLKVEQEIQSALKRAREEWIANPRRNQLSLFNKNNKSTQAELDLSGITNERFWEEAEAKIYENLKRYADNVSNNLFFQRQLFVQDVAEGFAFLDVCRKRYDVVLMNPPFGEPTKNTETLLSQKYGSAKTNLYTAFINRAIEFSIERAYIGAITSKTWLSLSSFKKWRLDFLKTIDDLPILLDAGYGVLDSAYVETCAYIIRTRTI